MRSVHLLRCLLAASAMLLLTACSDEPAPATETPRPVKLFTVADPSATQIREFPGRLKSPEEAQLSFRIGGELKRLLVREGQTVNAGELIAELDNTDHELRLKDRQATYELSRSQLERIKQLVDRQMVSRAEYEERQAQFNQAEAALNLARQDLTYTRLTAPFAGVVARSHVERFQVVQPNQAIITLFSGESMDVVFQLPENLVSSLRTTTAPETYKPKVRMENLPGIELDAVYKEHASQADPQTLTYQVTLSIQPPPGVVMLPGMSATVLVDFARLRTDDTLPLTVPVEAVFSPDTSGADRRQVWVIAEGENGLTVTARDVKVGQLTRNGIDIIEGLAPGEVIVAAGGAELAEGNRVRAWERERGL